MDNPDDDDRIIINVKGVRKASWNRATRAASLRKIQYGQLVSDALDFQAEMEARGIEAPGKARLTDDQITARLTALAGLAQGIAALKAAGARSVGIATLSRGLANLLAEMPRDLRIGGRIRNLEIGQESVKRAMLEGELHE
jgi:hypothetical protein